MFINSYLSLFLRLGSNSDVLLKTIACSMISGKLLTLMKSTKRALTLKQFYRQASLDLVYILNVINKNGALFFS